MSFLSSIWRSRSQRRRHGNYRRINAWGDSEDDDDDELMRMAVEADAAGGGYGDNDFDGDSNPVFR